MCCFNVKHGQFKGRNTRFNCISKLKTIVSLNTAAIYSSDYILLNLYSFVMVII